MMVLLYTEFECRAISEIYTDFKWLSCAMRTLESSVNRGARMIRSKIDYLDALARAGYNTGEIRRRKLFGESALQKFRKGGIPSPGEMNKLCALLNCQPGDLLEYVPDASAAPPSGTE